MVYAVNAFQSSITGNLSPYITSGFEEHSLVPTISVVSNILSAVAYMVLARVLNLWDRSHGFCVMSLFAILGLILSATCKDIYTYCAAQCFYSVGFIGVIFSVDVITMDTSTLRDRGFAYAFTASPWFITAYAGAKLSEYFHESNWRWGYGSFAIILPFVAAGLVAVMQFNKRKAKKLGVLTEPVGSGRSALESFKYYIVEFDIMGVFLVSAGLALLLLPFSLAASAPEGWRTGYIIAMLVLGVILLLAFGVTQRIVPKPFMPYRLLVSRTVMGACLIDFTWQIAYYCWAGYYSSYLQVVYDLSVSEAGYITAIYDVVSGVWLLPVGYLIRRTGRFKWLLVVGMPLYAIGEGLMIRFRAPGYSIGWQVFCQILIAFGGSMFTIGEQVAVLAVSSHNDGASALAMLGLFGYIGGAVGNTVSAAIWTNTLPAALQRLLPAETKYLWEDIYDSLDVQLSYPLGDATRSAIMEAYAEAQRRMLIAGTSILVLALAGVVLVRNIRVDKVEQVKGLLF